MESVLKKQSFVRKLVESLCLTATFLDRSGLFVVSRLFESHCQLLMIYVKFSLQVRNLLMWLGALIMLRLKY